MSKKIKLDKIAYEPHPVSPERKKELNSQGFRILDAVFKPRDHVDPDASKAIADMTVAELKAYAEANGIDLGDATKKADITAAIELAQEDQ